jgi:hypothetical protein
MPGNTSVKDAVRRVPGLVAAKRSLLAGYRVVRPLRPPVESPLWVERLLWAPKDGTFFTGNGLARQCRYVLNYDAFHTNEHVENNWWFANSEYLEYFFRHLAPRDDYVLFTHNSNIDRPIDDRFRNRLDSRELTAWFSIQVMTRHPKLHPMPLGVGNPLRCDHDALKRVIAEPPPKSLMFEASFALWTNPAERRYCIDQTGIEPVPRVRQADEFYRRLASAYFCIAPAGNGVDCYRTWQALHLGTVPIVTRSSVTEAHPELPLIVLDDWSEFRSIDFTPELYARTWGDWDPADISLDRYLDRIKARIAHA